MEGDPNIRHSSNITNGSMFHTFYMENVEWDTNIHVYETMPFEIVDSRDNTNSFDEDMIPC